MKIVLDTNVLVSGLISQGSPPGGLTEAWRSGRFTLLTSRAQLIEFRRVLGYERLQKYVNQDQAQTLVETIVSVAEILDEELRKIQFSPDPDDNLIIASAIVGEADLIVTGDKSVLLFLKEVEGIRIVAPRQALEDIGGNYQV